MKKIFLLLAAAFATVSCSDDDNNKTAGPPPMLLTHFTTSSETNGFNLDYTLTYDEQHRLKKTVKTGDSNVTMTFYYNDANVVTNIDVLDGANEREITFTYDAQNHMTSFKMDDAQPTAVVYNAATQTYTINTIELQLNDAGDVLSTNALKFGYAGIGSFASVNGPNIQLINNLTDGMYIFVGSRSAIESIKDYEGNDIYTIINTFNESGYPSKVVIDARPLNLLVITAELEYSPF